MSSGIEGFVNVNGVERDFGKWDLSKKSALVERRSFKSRGHPRRKAGQYDATLTLEGIWEVGSCPLTVGAEYTFQCGTATGVFLAITALVGEIKPSNDMADSPRLTVTADASTDINLSIT